MDFEYLKVKYSFRKIRKLRKLKTKFRMRGKDFVAHEELRMLKKMLLAMKGRSLYSKRIR
jgi:hypothetical protein